MISKSLFFNLMKEEVKQKLWVIAITVLLFFFAFPIFTLLNLEGYRELIAYNGDIQAFLMEKFMSCVSLNNEMLMVVMVVTAFLFAMQGFSYLQSKKQIDFYHGIPVKRETLFVVKYACSAICYLVPLVLFSAVSVIIFAVKGIRIDTNLMAIYFTMLAVSTVFYLFLYVVMMIAIILTGNKAISVFAVITLLLYSSVFIGMLEGMKSQFWISHYQVNAPLNIAKWASPISAYIMTIDEYAKTGNGSVWGDAAIALLFTAVLTALAVFLHKKRNSESVGKAIVFPKLEPILKVLLVLPISLFGGIVFESLTREGGLAWYVFGVIIIFVIGNALLEAIFAFDIRKAFNHKRLWLVSAVLLLGVNLFFIFDIGGYDTYIPAEDSVESMAVNFGFDNEAVVSNLRDADGRYIDFREMQLNNMEIKDYKVLYEFTKEKVEEMKGAGRIQLLNDRNSWYDIETYASRMIIKYHLRNGRDVYRVYEVDLQEQADSIAKIYENPQYLYSVNGISEGEVYKTVEYSSIYRVEGDTNKLPITGEQIAELAKLYQEDSTKKKLSIQKDMIPIGKLILRDDETWSERTLYLYSFYEKTIAYLQKATDGKLILEEEIRPEDVTRVTVRKMSESERDMEYDYASGNTFSTTDFDLDTWEITDPSQIQLILEEGVPLDYAYGNIYWEMNMDRSIEITVEYAPNGFENQRQISFYLPKGKAAQTILDSKK